MAGGDGASAHVRSEPPRRVGRPTYMELLTWGHRWAAVLVHVHGPFGRLPCVAGPPPALLQPGDDLRPLAEA
ncbi:hypothetical protein PAPYR_12638 [Paratrimastix pyriformis]|uniref:Uncharacterized protein n=1 Tax=Paratrimastix pyriformis TaxID=342808 RepID=A0ABQ8U3T8_9EUKA|nr:hypothetical protein PAPYR_12638 [Paratrimastix pyriformis]